MSFGNLKDNGNKGNNFPYQLAMLKLLGTIATNTASGADNELVNTDYIAIANGVGYSIGDSATRTLVLSVPGGNVVATLWWNNTTGLQIIPAPPYADFDQVSTATSVTVVNGAGVLAVNIQDGGNSITVDNANLDAPLSTLNKEATQLLVKTAVEAINTKLTTVARVPSAVNVTAGVGGTTTAGVRSVTLWFRGANGSVGGVPVPNNAIMTFTAGAEEDTLNGIAYVRPTTGEARIIITYTT